MKIEFRGKSKADGAWHYAYYHGDRHTPIIVNEEETPDTFIQNRIPIDPETVGQYTGLNDKNGVKIFKGDIVLNPNGCTVFVGAVEFSEGSWWIANKKNKDAIPLFDELNGIDILGNIWDNTELLEVSE